MLCAKDLKVGYEDRIIIDNLNLSIKQGEIVSIIGPNGCGKSTLLKTLSRMISPISGKVYLEGTELKYLKNKLISQKICLLSQHNQAPNDLTVEQLVIMDVYHTKNGMNIKVKRINYLLIGLLNKQG
mgnify:CR=1 FL=1